jgi:hypothetical protein
LRWCFSSRRLRLGWRCGGAAAVRRCMSRWCISSRRHRLGWRWVLLQQCTGALRAGASPCRGIGLVGDVVLLCCCAVVLVALVHLLEEALAWLRVLLPRCSGACRAGASHRGSIGLVLVGNGCCCYSAVVLIVLALLRAEASGWLAMGAAATVQWCSSRWCCSSRRHRLGW